jgi:hypothetical protein
MECLYFTPPLPLQGIKNQSSGTVFLSNSGNKNKSLLLLLLLLTITICSDHTTLSLPTRKREI